MEPEHPSLREEVIAHFARTVGPVSEKSQIEIVPTTWPPVAIHVIPAGPGREYVTLFTTGMSDEPMDVPEGGEDFAYAEIFIQLPADWPTQELQPATVWPFYWLRRMAGYPHGAPTWLGGPVTIFATTDPNEPPEPLAEGVPFTCFLLCAKERFESRDGRTVQLYHAFPLHPDERKLELDRGLPDLMRALDRSNVPFVVNLSRPSVAAAERRERPIGCLFSGVVVAGLLAALGTLIAWIWTPGMGWWTLSVLGGLVAAVFGLTAVAPAHPIDAAKTISAREDLVVRISYACHAAFVAILVAWIWSPEMGWWALGGLGASVASFIAVIVFGPKPAAKPTDEPPLPPLANLMGWTVLAFFAGLIATLVAWAWIPAMGWWSLGMAGGLIAAIIGLGIASPKKPDE